MCLVVIAFRQDPACPLIIAGNRDEFHDRPAAAAHWWHDEPGILGGRDLEAGGTWLALSRDGRFGTVTNYREAVRSPAGLRSRGLLVTDFLKSGLDPLGYLRAIEGGRHAGFNLFVSDGQTLAYASNRGSEPLALDAGVYGLANAELDAPWSKVERSKRRLAGLLRAGRTDDEALFELLADREQAPEADGDDGHLPPATARALTAPFIVLPEYGTRCSTVVRAFADGHWTLAERRFAADGSMTGETSVSVG